MTKNAMKMTRVAAGIAAALMLAGLLPGTAGAQERERREFREPYHTPHMVYDDRYHHGHYYPAFGYRVAALPPGYLSVSFGPRHLFFHGGVWYEPRGGAYFVVRPPFGVVIPVLPLGYTTVMIAGVPYYYANDVYYTQGPGGYAVAAPPAGAQYAEMPSSPPDSPPGPPPYSPPPPPGPSANPGAPPAGTGMWYYCDSAKGYYPYAQQCPEGWRSVQPPPR
jgi:hypothetical protein